MFISFEGAEGAGKSTQTKLLKDALTQAGHQVVLTAEPGGTPIGEQIRAVLLNADNTEMTPTVELLLYAAARRQHIEQLILPSLESGKIVITDRYSDSTVAYQGYARGLDMELIKEIDRICADMLKPALTILLDVDVNQGLKRNRDAGKRDRLELEQVEFHEKVRQGFLEIAKAEPKRFVVIDSMRAKDVVHCDVLKAVQSRLKTK